MGVDIWNLPDDMEEEEKEAERQFRANEIVIARRLVAVVATNFVVWLPLIIIGVASLAGHQVSDVSCFVMKWLYIKCEMSPRRTGISRIRN